MTGGRRRPEDYEPPRFAPPILPPFSEDEKATQSALGRFKRAMAFRRNVSRALRSLRISFAQWRTLEAAWRLIRQTDEPVSHLDVARDMELDESSLSRLMWSLSRRGLVDHDLDGRSLAYRVRVTKAGQRLIEAASRIVADRAAGR